MKKEELPDHALYAPSSCYRNLNCKSAIAMNDLAEKQGFKPETSVFAAEGTKAHELIDLLLNGTPLEEHPDGDTFDEEMEKHCRAYVKFIEGLEINFNKNFTIIKTGNEEKAIFDKQFFGTVDYFVIGEHKKTGEVECIICDFKYGRGVEVEAEDNEQILCYALCLQKHLSLHFNKVHAFIYQPRTPGKEFTRWSIDADRIAMESGLIIENKNLCLKLLEEHDITETKAGEWCRFCNAKRICPAYKDNLNGSVLAVIPELPEIGTEPKLPKLTELTIEQKIEVFKRRKVIKKFIDDVCADLLIQATSGKDVPGYKMVKSTPKRCWNGDVTTIGNALIAKGVSDPYKLSLVGIGEVEKQIGKNKIGELTGFTKISYQLVDDSDKREAVQVSLGDIPEIDFPE